MSVTLSMTLGLAAVLPPPPIPGGAAADDVWWRILGILLISLVTVAIFLYLFRQPTPIPAEGRDEADREDEELTRLAAQLAARGDEELAGVIPLRPRHQIDEESGSEASNAAARLRRILGQSTRGEPSDRPKRRRLGDRSTEAPSLADRKQPATLAAAHQLDADDVAGSPVKEPGDHGTTSAPGDFRGDAAEIAHRESAGDDQRRDSSAGTTEADDVELLGDLVNRLPSEADQVDTPAVEESTPRSPARAGEIPTEEDLDRLAATPQGPGNIVPFVPRGKKRGQTKAGSKQEPATAGTAARVSPITVDAGTRDEIEAVVRQLLFYANVGELLQGFGLYTDEHLRRFMAESEMPEREFQALFAAVPPKEPDDWTRIDFISRVVRLDGGQVSADVTYVDGHQPNGTERLTFVQDQSTRRWLIDDIQAM